MASYSYATCLDNAYKVNWRIGDVLGDRRFDAGHRWLPPQLSGAAGIGCLDDDEKIKLTHVEMGAYAHIFGYVEEFIAPQMLHLARDHELADRAAFDALTNFAAEEVKHMTLFRKIRQRVDDQLGFALELLGDEKEVARAVLAKSTGAVLLLTAAIEWFTQLHYVGAMKDDEVLDPLTKQIFKAHWQEESQHARMDHLETLRAFAGLSDEEKDQAITDLIELVGAVDGLIQQQTEYDVRNLERYLGRRFTEAERQEIRDNVLRAKRYCFIESGVTHPNFAELFGLVTNEAQQQRVQAALATIL